MNEFGMCDNNSHLWHLDNSRHLIHPLWSPYVAGQAHQQAVYALESQPLHCWHLLKSPRQECLVRIGAVCYQPSSSISQTYFMLQQWYWLSHIRTSRYHKNLSYNLPDWLTDWLTKVLRSTIKIKSIPLCSQDCPNKLLLVVEVKYKKYQQLVMIWQEAPFKSVSSI